MLLRVYQLFFYAVLSIVLLLALLPSDEVLLTTGWDKANHFLAFMTLAALLDIAYPIYRYWPIKMSVLFFIGVAIECLQWLTQYRVYSMDDVFADSVAIVAYWFLSRHFQILVAWVELRFLSAWR